MVTISGGAAFERKLAEVAKQIGKGAALKVGFLEGATYPDGTSVPLVAVVQNFGAPAKGIPPRPFFSNMVKDKSEGWAPSFRRILKNTGNDLPLALAQMGEGIKGQLQQSIRDTNAPPLAESTIAAKGFEKPLIDSSNMINSADYEVSEEGVE